MALFDSSRWTGRGGSLTAKEEADYFDALARLDQQPSAAFEAMLKRDIEAAVEHGIQNPTVYPGYGADMYRGVDLRDILKQFPASQHPAVIREITKDTMVQTRLGATTAMEPNPRKHMSQIAPEHLLAARMGWRQFPPEHFQHAAVFTTEDKVHVWIIMPNSEGIALTEDRDTFPNDELCAKLRLLAK